MSCVAGILSCVTLCVFWTRLACFEPTKPLLIWAALKRERMYAWQHERNKPDVTKLSAVLISRQEGNFTSAIFVQFIHIGESKHRRNELWNETMKICQQSLLIKFPTVHFVQIQILRSHRLSQNRKETRSFGNANVLLNPMQYSGMAAMVPKKVGTKHNRNNKHYCSMLCSSRISTNKDEILKTDGNTQWRK